MTAADEGVVRPWLRAYIAEHEGWWRAARGVTGGAMDEQREWDDMVAPGEAKLVDVALGEDGAPVGLIMAEARADRHLGVPTVVIQWIAVAPTARGSGLSAQLLDHALRWGAERGATSAEVFVTAANTPAVRAYERAGFSAVDVRMMRPLSA